MSDAAFKSAPYAGYTTPELELMSKSRGICLPMMDELHRRERVRAGDTSVMTDGERLNHAKAPKQAQIVALRLNSPMRPLDRTSAPVDGLALFDAHRSPTLF